MSAAIFWKITEHLIEKFVSVPFWVINQRLIPTYILFHAYPPGGGRGLSSVQLEPAVGDDRAPTAARRRGAA